ncbi:MAG TPA: transposase, partial [Methylibium sp.]
DPKHLGVVPGIVMALHTWGRTLNHHPHVHCLVSAGGLAPGDRWRDARKGFLLPVEVVKRLFRGKLLHALSTHLRGHQLRLPPEQPLAHWMGCIRAQWRKNFNVRLAEPYPYGDGVVRYLARYVKGGPINERSLRTVDAQQVAFTYTDHRDGQRKLMRLQPGEFIDRVLWHAPPRGQHTVRHYGLYASGSGHLRALCAKQIAGVRSPSLPPLFSAPSCITLQPQCPTCHVALNVVDTLQPVHRTGEISSCTSPSPRLCPTPRSIGHATRAFNPTSHVATHRALFFGLACRLARR